VDDLSADTLSQEPKLPDPASFGSLGRSTEGQPVEFFIRQTAEFGDRSCRSSCAALAVRNRATERIGLLAESSGWGSRGWAELTMDRWHSWAIRSRIEPIKVVAKTLHRRRVLSTASPSIFMTWNLSKLISARIPCYPADAGSATDRKMAAGRTDVPQFALGL
jgi:hypothetical protein